MSKSKNKIKLFEEKQVRAVWDENAEKWWFSVVDVCAVLTDCDYQTARTYWRVLKHRLAGEGNQTVTNCNQLKMSAPDGKMRLTARAESPTGNSVGQRPTLARNRNSSPERAWAMRCCRRPYRAYPFLCPFRRALPYAVACRPFGAENEDACDRLRRASSKPRGGK